jgi:putative FmdB family regulatory protein
MALYEFACPGCRPIEAYFPMGSAPESIECPECGGRAPRVYSAPYLSVSGRAAFKLIDSTQKSAHEPQVIDGALPQTTRKRARTMTSHPLYRKLPRP